MKKLYVWILVAALCAGLTACTEKTTAVIPDAMQEETADATPESASANAEALTDAELAAMRKYVSGTEELLEPGMISGETIDTNRRIGCFFKSFYDDVRDLDLGAFLAYCDAGQTLESGADDAEFQAFTAAAGWTDDEAWKTLDGAPVPVWRYRVADINALLEEYAGITLDDLSHDWKTELIYLPEYDAFYNDTSDFDPGTFSAAYGEKDGNTVTLYEEPLDGAVLTLRKSGDSWLIVSHTKKDGMESSLTVEKTLAS